MMSERSLTITRNRVRSYTVVAVDSFFAMSLVITDSRVLIESEKSTIGRPFAFASSITATTRSALSWASSASETAILNNKSRASMC